MEKIWTFLNYKISHTMRQEEISNKYKELHTDEERVWYTLNLLQQLSIVPTANGDIKHAKKSEEFREQGNKIFTSSPLTSSTCLDAFKLYCKSIAYAPVSSKELALAYANRSAVLCKMKKYVECLQDIDRAFSLDYPDPLRSKLYLRKVECLAALNKPDIEETVKEAQSWMDKLSINDSNRTKFNEKLTSIQKSVPTTKEENNELATKHDLPPLVSANPEAPCASDALAIKFNKQYGRHVVAARDIAPGEVLVIEKPYSMILPQNNLQTHCFNCLEVCWANIPCDHCTCAMYCSEDCRSADWKASHDIECAVFPSLIKLDFSNLDLLSLRLTIHAIRKSGGIQKLKAELKEVEEQTDLRTKGFSKDGVFHSDKYRSVYALATNTDKRSVPDLFRKSMDACAILYYLLRCTSMFGDYSLKHLETQFSAKDVIFVGGLIMRHQQIIPSNGHSISEEHGLHYVERGLAILPFLSLLNHSCDNNVYRYSASGRMCLYSLYPIEKGEQILDNYGKHYALTPKSERRQSLMEQYHFYCDCLPCRKDWPLYDNIKPFKYLVKNPQIKKKISQALLKLEEYYNLANEAKNVLDKPQIIYDLLNMICVLYNHAPRPCKELNDAVETLKRVYSVHGDRFEIPKV